MSRSVELQGAQWTKTRPQTYMGVSGEEEPRSFDAGMQQFEVLQILDQWRSPEHRYFKVRVKGAKFYCLRCRGAGDDWEVAPLGAHR